ncbi:Hypothetical predicted protein [Podarcis lilfordi]|uniref:Uncharacterized protein n=1 Tax=Podarcis lilfordi TaxID=74358 RepID=A0AA35KPB3_9SAUR|nr:Hypothetical predicted protein [Podarcis lilfordi]
MYLARLPRDRRRVFLKGKMGRGRLVPAGTLLFFFKDTSFSPSVEQRVASAAMHEEKAIWLLANTHKAWGPFAAVTPRCAARGLFSLRAIALALSGFLHIYCASPSRPPRYFATSTFYGSEERRPLRFAIAWLPDIPPPFIVMLLGLCLDLSAPRAATSGKELEWRKVFKMAATQGLTLREDLKMGTLI